MVCSVLSGTISQYVAKVPDGHPPHPQPNRMISLEEKREIFGDFPGDLVLKGAEMFLLHLHTGKPHCDQTLIKTFPMVLWAVNGA